MACLQLVAPIPSKEIGLAETHRAGIAPDAAGNPMICFAGGHKTLCLLAGLPGAQRWPVYDCLAFPLNRTNMLVCETIGRIEEATDEYVQTRGEILAAPRALYADRYPVPPAGEPAPFQHQVDTFCCAAEAFEKGFHGFGIFSEQGTGKSRVACDLLRVFGGHAAVVVAQNSTLLQWADWLRRFGAGREIRVLSGMPVARREALIDEIARGHLLLSQPVVFLVNWEVLARLQDAFIRLKPELVIADEATRAKERTAQMSKALHRIGEAARYRIAMTGTPLGNSPADLWSIFRFLEPTLYGKGFWSYMNSYFMLGGYSGKEFVGFNPPRVGDFIGRLYSCAYRITKSTIQDMPPKLYETVRLKMSPVQQKLYDQVKEDLYARLVHEDGTEATVSVPNALVQLVRLQQITAGLFPAESEPGETARSVAIESVKTEWLRDYCQETLRDSDAQIVVWCRFTAEIQAICRALTGARLKQGFDFEFIDGSVPLLKRRSYQVRFNCREEPLRLLICQIQAMAFGVDLPQADTMIYHSASFSFLERAQSVERGHRMGRVRPYQIIDLVCEKSIDGEILAALRRKQNLSDTLLVQGLGTLLG